ncbi:MAG: tetratricopeptide repeat protein [Comamonas sp.]
MPTTKNTAPRTSALLAMCALVLAGCASKAPQGYGVAEQSTAAQAQQQMEKAEQANQVDSQQTYLNLISKMQQANQWYASLAHTEAFERQFGATPQLRLLRADALRNTAQLAQARSAYEALLTDATSQTVARARRGLGLLLASQGQLDQAVSQLEQARSLNPIDADVLSDLAYAHMLAGQPQSAQLPIMQAAQLAPGNARVQLNLALYWLATGERSQAAHLLQRLQQPQAKNVPALVDENSIKTLQSQLRAVQQAMAQQASAPSTEPTALPAQAATPDAEQADANALPIALSTAVEKQP